VRSPGFSLSESFRIPIPEGEATVNEAVNLSPFIEKGERMYAMLNEVQRQAADQILELNSTRAGSRRVFFIDGPGGTGKTFLYIRGSLQCV
jgi:hypothetical protein